jgi:hypothetical protein
MALLLMDARVAAGRGNILTLLRANVLTVIAYVYAACDP